MKPLLIIVDRDGTLIELVDYLGKEGDWKEQIKLNIQVAELMRFAQKKFSILTYVVSNQQGVARGYFSQERVEEINNDINRELQVQGIKIDGWNYCPDVDNSYAKKHPEITFDNLYVKAKTKRKPSIEMVLELLKKDKLDLGSLEKIIVLGDADDDKKLATNLNASYIDVRGKDYKFLIDEFLFIMKKNNFSDN